MDFEKPQGNKKIPEQVGEPNTELSYEEQRMQNRHDQDDAFLARVGPEWNDKELPKPAGEWLSVHLTGSAHEPEPREHYGTYSVNNDKIAYCSKLKGGGGAVFIAPFSTERMKVLEDAGYMKSGLGVPFSSGDMPAEIKNQWWSKFERNEIAKKFDERK
jgi:hypothetical protein